MRLRTTSGEVKVTINSIDKALELIYFPVEDSLRRVAKPPKRRGTKIKFRENKTICWQLIFLQSVANGCSYRGEVLPQSKWQWPKGIWFQKQLGRRRLKAIGLSAPQVRN
jgi:hypothetical protein